MHLTWLGLHHRDLTVRQLHDLLRLRHQVFVVEQDCPTYQDIDGLDVAGDTHHVLGTDRDTVVAVSRILPPGLAGPQARIGRVVVAPERRGAGMGHALMAETMRACGRLWPGEDVLLSAQAHLEDFYRSHGFAPAGGVHLEDGIPHLDMVGRS